MDLGREPGFEDLINRPDLADLIIGPEGLILRGGEVKVTALPHHNSGGGPHPLIWIGPDNPEDGDEHAPR